MYHTLAGQSEFRFAMNDFLKCFLAYLFSHSSSLIVYSVFKVRWRILYKKVFVYMYEVHHARKQAIMLAGGIACMHADRHTFTYIHTYIHTNVYMMMKR